MNFITRVFQRLPFLAGNLLSLLFPSLCSGCSNHLNRGESGICSGCLYRLPYTDHYLYKDNRVAKHFWGKVPFHAAMALLRYKKGSRVQRIIYNLKYNGRSEVGIKLGMMMAERLLKSEFYRDVEVIIPVPLHKSKEKKRGYNQSAFIAEGLSAILDIPVNDTTLIRNIATESQTLKGRYSRHQNMQRAFSVIKPGELSGKHILIVDDVVTTGATITACAIELQRCGIRKLSIAVAACAE
ncbi:MAG TPA: ComF family protein [Pedobacter sp.]|uniref:ComF family protein n=1 Tax=Pedobacter sp. TaxID=1411316 RepID=UPI002C307041|nr:ComF family protein [Pedobacter sp.]HMI01579.1 ComF family protein [Pedobacter sp.]